MDPKRNDPPRNGPNKPGDDNNPKRNIWLPLIIAVVALIAIGTIYNAISESQYTQTTWSDFQEAVASDNLEEVQLKYDRIIYLTKEEAAKPAAQQKACYTGLPSGNVMGLADELYAMGVKVDQVIVEDNSGILLILYYLGMGLLLFGVMSTLTKRMSGDGMMGSFGKNKAKVYMEKQTGVTFKDVAGQDEAKESLQEIIDFLHNPQTT